MHKAKVLMLVSRFPYPLDKGDKLRAYHQLKELNKHFDVTLVALTDNPVSKVDSLEIQKNCAELIVLKLNFATKLFNMIAFLFGSKPIQVGYFYNKKAQFKIDQLIRTNEFQHIYCQLIRTAEYIKNQHHITKTIDYMDALSVGIERRIKLQPFYKKWLFKLEANRLKKYERYIFDYFENHTIISEQDKQLINHPERDRIICTPNGIDAKFFETVQIEKEYDFVFVGNMSYPPNIEAVQFIAKEILPQIDNSTLLISGSSPSPLIKKIAVENKNIEVTGWVDDIRTSYLKGNIFLAPMMIGTGMQNKLLEAMALGIPCITTPLANNAINAKNGKEILVGSTNKEIISLIDQLNSDQDLYSNISKNAIELVRTKFNWEKSIERLIELIKQSKP